jgi:lipopolysaccharide biosynthesis regulator YciM
VPFLSLLKVKLSFPIMPLKNLVDSSLRQNATFPCDDCGDIKRVLYKINHPIRKGKK